jgi:nucleotide-binding universal stress UspA family protein
MEGTEIIVGTDGSTSSVAAVRWAAREAQRRSLPLRIVHAFDWGWPAGRSAGTDELREPAQAEADATLADVDRQAREVEPGVTVRRSAVLGEPAPVLLDEAKEAALLVVGNRGRGGFASLLLGSVSQRVATHATCPVAVVRGRADATDGPVVAGFDGSPASQAVLSLAFQEAVQRKAELVVIRAFPPPPPGPPPWRGDIAPLVEDLREREEAGREALAEAMSPWRDKYPRVQAETSVAHGGPARVLVGMSHTAQLVIVGGRGHGGWSAAVLGSVGLQLIHHADCPVLISRS